MKKIDLWMLNTKSKIACAIDKTKKNLYDFYTEEHGVSNVVATIIILLIVVLIIGVFWNRLSGWLNGIMDQIFGFNIKTGSDTSLTEEKKNWLMVIPQPK